MGMYFEIVLRNQKTNEKIYEEYFTFETAEFAWKEVTEIATEFARQKFEEDKYWMLLSITDVTRR
jgi:hypothetical protein